MTDRDIPPRQPQPDTTQNPPPLRRFGTAQKWLLGGIGMALTGILLAPQTLSSGDLMRWAASPDGLGLQGSWPWVVMAALDCAAAVCVLFVVFNASVGEGAGTFGLLVWAFAGASAWANHRHGQRTPAADDAMFFAGMSLAGPLLLHTTVHRIRRWARRDAREAFPRRAHFGLRWLVAFRDTLAAWRESVRAGISNPAAAIARAREVRYLQALDDAGRIRYAAGACATHDPHALRSWLLDRGVELDPATHEQALWRHPATTPIARHATATATATGAAVVGGPGAPALDPPAPASPPPAPARSTPRPRRAATTRPAGRRPTRSGGGVAPQERREQVAGLYLSRPGITDEELRATVDPSASLRTIQRDLEALRAEGRIPRRRLQAVS